MKVRIVPSMILLLPLAAAAPALAQSEHAGHAMEQMAPAQPAAKAKNLPAAEETAKETLNTSPRHGEWVNVSVAGTPVKTWVVYPERKTKAPVVIVIHEIYGLTDWIRGVADQLAAEGFIAVAQPGLNAAVVYYGTAPQDLSTLASIKAPVLGLYGGDDARVDATIEGTVAEMKKQSKVYEPEIYEGAGHGFLRAQSGKDGANMKATEKAWPRTLAFLRKYTG